MTRRIAPSRRLEAVLVDRDGTLVEDVPYNRDPARVRPLPGVAAALDALRSADLPVAVVSNQSGVARGLITASELARVEHRVETLLGPFAGWFVCCHGPGDGCGCRKPRPGLLLRAAEALGVEPAACAVIGDIGADVDAALAAGSWPILVPTPRTRAEEVSVAPVAVGSFALAAQLVLDHASASGGARGSRAAAVGR